MNLHLAINQKSKMTDHNHQFIEMNSRKEFGLLSKEVICSECGEMRCIHEDGRIEIIKEENKKE